MRRAFRRRGAVRLGLALALLAGLPWAARGHELGTLRTTATFDNKGNWEATIIVDREHIPPGFAANARLPSRYGPVAGLPGNLAVSAGPVLAAVANDSEASFDGHAAAVKRVDWIDTGRAASEWSLRLSGPIPAGARTFTWINRARLGSYLLTLRTDGDPVPARMWVEGGEASASFPLPVSVVPPATGALVRRFFRSGLTNVLPNGAEDAIFLFGVFLFSWRRRSVLLQAGAFAAAEGLALATTAMAMATAGPAIPVAAVRLLMALSVVWVAVDNVFARRAGAGRTALVFGFGLAHGMGFGYIFRHDAPLPSGTLPALVSYAGGIGLGQLAVVLVSFVLVGQPYREEAWYRRRVVVPASLLIAALGILWVAQRAGVVERPAGAPSGATSAYTLKRKSITSPSWTT